MSFASPSQSHGFLYSFFSTEEESWRRTGGGRRGKMTTCFLSTREVFPSSYEKLVEKNNRTHHPSPYTHAVSVVWSLLKVSEKNRRRGEGKGAMKERRGYYKGALRRKRGGEKRRERNRWKGSTRKSRRGYREAAVDYANAWTGGFWKRLAKAREFAEMCICLTRKRRKSKWGRESEDERTEETSPPSPSSSHRKEVRASSITLIVILERFVLPSFLSFRVYVHLNKQTPLASLPLFLLPFSWDSY